VVTRAGLPVRLICFDWVGSAGLLGLILEDGREQCYTFFPDGDFMRGDNEHYYDLFMAPVVREGWIGVSPCIGFSGCIGLATDIYNTERAALSASNHSEDKIIKIQWEE